MKRESIGQLLIKIAWWVRTVVLIIPTILLVGLTFSLFSYEDVFRPILFVGNLTGFFSIYLLILILGQGFALLGLDRVPRSREWSIAFIALGAISFISISGLIYVIGAILCLREREKRLLHIYKVKQEQFDRQNEQKTIRKVKRKRKKIKS